MCNKKIIFRVFFFRGRGIEEGWGGEEGEECTLKAGIFCFLLFFFVTLEVILSYINFIFISMIEFFFFFEGGQHLSLTPPPRKQGKKIYIKGKKTNVL